MNTEKLTAEELRVRKLEFLTKLRGLIEEYVVDVTYYDSTYIGMPEHFCIITDAHLQDSWDNDTFLKKLDEDSLDFCIDELKTRKGNVVKTIK